MTRRREGAPRVAFAAFVAVLAVVSFVIGGAAEAASATKLPACRVPRGAVLLASSRLAVVYTRTFRLSDGTRTTLVGCWKPKRKRTILTEARADYLSSDAIDTVLLAGRYVAFEFFARSRFGSASDEVWRANLATGRVTFIDHVSSTRLVNGVPAPDTDAVLEDMVVNGHGRMVWQLDRETGDEIRARDSAGNRVLDSAPFELTDLELRSDNTASWYRGTQQRTAVLR